MYRALIKRALALVLVAAAIPTARANVIVTVEPDRVTFDQPIRLTIQADVQLDDLDLSPLDQSFTVAPGVNQQQRCTFRSCTYSTTRTLFARRTGTLELPPLNINGQLTAPVPIVVTKGSEYVELIADTRTPYVQQFVPATIQITLPQGPVRNPVFNITPTLGLSLTSLERRTTERFTDDDGREWTRHQFHVGLVFQEPGKRVVGPMTITILRPGQGHTFGSWPTSTLRLGEQEFDVKAIPDDFPRDHSWLIAEDVNLELQEQQTDEPPRVGEPRTREVSLHALGARSDLLPNIPVPDAQDNALFSVVQSDSQGDLTTNPISATRDAVHTIIPTQPGQLTIPALRVPWWDTASDSLRWATVPPAVVTVLPATAGTYTLTPDATTSTVARSSIAPWIVTALVILGWVSHVLWIRAVWIFDWPWSQGVRAWLAAWRGNPAQCRDAFVVFAKSGALIHSSAGLWDIAQVLDGDAKRAVEILERAQFGGDLNAPTRRALRMAAAGLWKKWRANR